MAGIHARVEPDAIFCLGGWHSEETFYCHYIVQAIPCTYTYLIFVKAGEGNPQAREEEGKTGFIRPGVQLISGWNSQNMVIVGKPPLSPPPTSLNTICGVP